MDDYRDTINLYLEHCVQGNNLSVKTELSGKTWWKELLASLFSGRGEATLAGVEFVVEEAERTIALGFDCRDFVVSLEHVNPEHMRQRLGEFRNMAEAAGGDLSLAEKDEEDEDIIPIGERLLADRHDVELQLEGMRWFLELRPELKKAMAVEFAVFQKRLTVFDEAAKAGIHYFIPYNLFRRSFHEHFPDADRFWWWHLRSDCDFALIYKAVEGEEHSEHLRSCLDCKTLLHQLRNVRMALKNASGMPVKHPEPEQLIALYEGELGGEVEQALELHLKLCKSCAAEFEMIRRADEPDVQRCCN